MSMARQPDNKSADKSAANLKSDDSALIRELALLLDETSLTEIEIERAGLRVRVARNISIAASMPASLDRKSTRLNSSHVANSYAVFCLKKKRGSRTTHSLPRPGPSLNAPRQAQ